MTPSLPVNPSLDRFRRDARTLLREVRGGDPDALAAVTRHDGAGAPVDPATFTLTAAQRVVARVVGFTNWAQLQTYLRIAEPLRRDPTIDVGADPRARFLSLACLTYSQDDGPDRWSAAEDLLRATPGLPEQDLYVAAAVGDPVTVRKHLDDGPDDARTLGGPFGWTALFHLAASRVPQRDPLATAQFLLDGGADPNAGYLWLGLPTPFTMVTMCFGEGEAGPGRQPRHPAADDLAPLLIAHGADPNDAQTLYNRMFGRDDGHLRILLEHGLGHGTGGEWHRRLGEALEDPTEMVQRQVDWARDHGLTDRLELLAAHGFTQGCPADAPSPWRMRGSPGTPAGVRAFAAAGGDVNALIDGHALLHHAAWIGDVELVEALLECGADPELRDSDHGSTALGWAEHGCAEATAEMLRSVES